MVNAFQIFLQINSSDRSEFAEEIKYPFFVNSISSSEAITYLFLRSNAKLFNSRRKFPIIIRYNNETMNTATKI